MKKREYVTVFKRPIIQFSVYTFFLSLHHTRVTREQGTNWEEWTECECCLHSQYAIWVFKDSISTNSTTCLHQIWAIQSSQPSPWKQWSFTLPSESPPVCLCGPGLFRAPVWRFLSESAQERHERKGCRYLIYQSDSMMTQFSMCLFAVQFVLLSLRLH